MLHTEQSPREVVLSHASPRGAAKQEFQSAHVKRKKGKKRKKAKATAPSSLDLKFSTVLHVPERGRYRQSNSLQRSLTCYMQQAGSFWHLSRHHLKSPWLIYALLISFTCTTEVKALRREDACLAEGDSETTEQWQWKKMAIFKILLGTINLMPVAKYKHAASLDLPRDRSKGECFPFPLLYVSRQLWMLLRTLTFQSFWDEKPSHFSSCIWAHILCLTNALHLSSITQL